MCADLRLARVVVSNAVDDITIILMIILVLTALYADNYGAGREI